MSFKKDKYEVISKAVSGDMANFLYMYSLLKRQVCKTFMDTRRISKFTKDFGTWQDPQVPNTYSVYGDIAMDTLLYSMGSIMEQKSGYKLVPTYSYMRVYKKGDVLKRHKDRMSCEISTTMNLGGDPWPIYLNKNSKDGKHTPKGYKPSRVKGIKINLNPGDMLIYRGCELEHWRNKFEGNECAQVFLHYNKAGKNSNLMDGRLHLGLPSDIKRRKIMMEERLNFKIKQLETNLEMEKSVKQSEKQINEDFKKQLKVKDIQIETLSELNWKLVNKVADLQQQLSKFYGL